MTALNDDLKLISGGTPFYLPGNRIGCVLVHGYTGTPCNMRWLGDHLNAQGYTVYAPRLTGHGTRPEDMRGVPWEAWYYDVLTAYELLRTTCDRVFVGGLSMGAALSLMLAAREPVEGVISLSTPYMLRDWRVPLLPVISAVMPMRNKPQTEAFNAFCRRVQDEGRRRGSINGYASYMTYPTSSIIQLNKLLAAMRASLPHVTAPVLMIHSHSDDMVPINAMNAVYERLGSTEKHNMTLDQSLHVITMDVECGIVFDAAANFIAAHSNKMPR